MAVLLRARSHLLSGAIRRSLLGERGRGARRFSTDPTTVGEAAATGRGATTGGTAANTSGVPTKTNGGGPANGRGAANGGGGASGGGAPANGGGGAVTGSGNGSGGCGCAAVADLRTDVFTEVGRVRGCYNTLAEVDEKLMAEITSVKLEAAMNQVRSKEKLVTTIYTMFGSAVAFTFAGATLIGGYVHDFVVHEAAKEVRAKLRLDKAKGTTPPPAAPPAAGSPPK
ncbi:keratin, type I cytoskeletal 13-like [Triticum dicoccoides]|uniref:keratin, type I cytoskeletal 13-like n=1 Tax=Triticum dicoccoides TaxID=85692 RepID=UPI0018906EB2|nr:keratin, type I cytoskeletal 13-like [Triticum dicoccoides]XP_037431315.1 keratin, type I cytoskeletal 13-like [Triticum dicoccoides]XP_044385424.1 keratin, type I cytoskeletal 13-like [Triticum aestivum]